MRNLFPYTDAHELNLDWVIEQVKANNTKVKDLTHTVENLHFDFDSKADKATTYTKSEVDTLLLGKANVSDIPDMSNYYDKTATDNLLANKANVSDLPDMSNYYDKTATDNLLANKADKATSLSGYGIADAYTKNEVNNLINDITPLTLTFTETTNAQGSFYIGNLTNLDSILLQVYTTESYFYLIRPGGGGRWVAICLNGNMQPVANVEVHMTVKYLDIS